MTRLFAKPRPILTAIAGGPRIYGAVRGPPARRGGDWAGGLGAAAAVLPERLVAVLGHEVAVAKDFLPK